MDSKKERKQNDGIPKRQTQNGRTATRPTDKVTLEIKEYARAVIENPDYQEKLKQRLLDGSAPQLEILMHYYAYGKPKPERDVGNNITVVIEGYPKVVPASPALTDQSWSKGEPS